MFAVGQDGDRVIVDLCGRRRDILMSCGDAETFEHAVRRHANGAETATPQLVRGERWGCRVESFDGLVAIRFYPPFGSTATRVPLSVGAARQLADLVEFKRGQAAYKMRFEFARG